MAKFFLARTEENAKTNIKYYLKLSLIWALIAATLRSLAYLFSFDEAIGYFSGGLLDKIATYFIIITCASILTGFVFISKDAELPKKLDNAGSSIFFASIFAGFISVADFAYNVYAMIGEDKFDYYKYIFAPEYRSDNAYIIRATAAIEIIGVFSAILAAVCFFLRASAKFDSKACAWFGFFPVIRALSGVARIYFEMEVQMNHPSKLMLEFALISIMISFLYEHRFFISENIAKPVGFVVVSCVALLISITAGISELIGFFSGNLSNGEFCIEAFFCLTMGLYIAARVISYVKSLENPVNEAAGE